MKPIIAALLLALLLASGCAVAQRGENRIIGDLDTSRASRDSPQAAAPTITATVIPTVWNIEVTTIPHVVEIRVPAGGNPRDFVALVPPGSPDTDYSKWQYTRNAKVGVLIFEGVKPGNYEARLFSLPGATLAPGKRVGAQAVIVPVPKPRPIEIDSKGKVAITRRATDTLGDVSIKIKEDESEIGVVADKSSEIKVKP